MATPRHISARGLRFIQSFETLKLKAYHIPGEQHWTIGWGHNGPDVHPGMTITRPQADRILREDLARFEAAVIRLVPRRWRRVQRRFDALVSIAFNLGEGVLTAAPPLTSLGAALKARLVTRSNARTIAAAMRLYVHGSGGEVLEGLVRRRRAEARLFTDPTPSYSTD